MFSKSTDPSITLYIPPAIYPAGSAIEGEVEINFRQLQKDNVEEVVLKFRGKANTLITRDKTTLVEDVKFVHEDVPLWSRGGAYPPADSDILRIPFRVVLPEDLPPSFNYKGRYGDQFAYVRYSLTAVGVRKGLFNLNKRHRVPLPVLPIDEVGASIRERCEAQAWKTFSKEDKIRRGLWGDYSTVHVQLALPDIPVLPLFSDIPYTITVTTTTAPLSQAKGHEKDVDKPVFPPVPRDPHEIEFNLHRKMKVRANVFSGKGDDDVMTILGGKETKRPQVPIDTDLPAKEWVPTSAPLVGDEKGKGKKDGHDDHPSHGEIDGKGSWVQRVVFQSTFKLNCPPSFTVTPIIECNYSLIVKVPFPGIGNSLKLEVPVTVTSGVDKSSAREPLNEENEAPILDLPPAYWDANSTDWDGDEKD